MILPGNGVCCVDFWLVKGLIIMKLLSGRKREVSASSAPVSPATADRLGLCCTVFFPAAV